MNSNPICIYPIICLQIIALIPYILLIPSNETKNIHLKPFMSFYIQNLEQEFQSKPFATRLKIHLQNSFLLLSDAFTKFYPYGIRANIRFVYSEIMFLS